MSSFPLRIPDDLKKEAIAQADRERRQPLLVAAPDAAAVVDDELHRDSASFRAAAGGLEVHQGEANRCGGREHEKCGGRAVAAPAGPARSRSSRCRSWRSAVG